MSNLSVLTFGAPDYVKKVMEVMNYPNDHWLLFAVTFAEKSGVGLIDKLPSSGTKLFLSNTASMRSRYRETEILLFKKGLNPTSVRVYGPFTGDQKLFMTALRNEVKFSKHFRWKIEYVSCASNELDAQIARLDGFAPRVKVATNDTPKETTDVKTSKKRKSRPLAKTEGTTKQFETNCSVNYPTPTVPLPAMSLKGLIKMRMVDFVYLTTSKYFDPDRDEFHFAFKNLWRFVGYYFPELNLVSEHRKLTETKGFKGSILDLADQMGVLDKVYAVAVGTFFKDPEMPKLTAHVKLPSVIQSSEAMTIVYPEPEMVPVDTGADTTFLPPSNKQINVRDLFAGSTGEMQLWDMEPVQSK